MMTLVLFFCLLATATFGVQCGKKLAVARHQGVRRKLPEALLIHLGVTVLTILYGMFMHEGLLWDGMMLTSSVFGLTLGKWWTQQYPPRELSVSQLRTDAILER